MAEKPEANDELRTVSREKLYWQNGQSSKPMDTVAQDLIEALDFDEENLLSWWEPSPEALALEPKATKPGSLLGAGLPAFTPGLRVDECRLFFPDGGLHLLRRGDEIHWFAFTLGDKSGNDPKDGWRKVQRVTERRMPVLLKGRDVLKNYGLPANLFGDIDNLQLRTYATVGKPFAWTLARRRKT